ncbi:MAG: EpsG family protein [Candidatus Brocadiaceae bacterium]|nr:EpsG family protein [Candidatus Brocadiaceae bacterium]
MIVYLVTILIILIVGILYLNSEAKTQRSYRRQYIVFVSILLILQSGLRNWAVGADTFAYYEGFERVKSYSWADILDNMSEYYLYGIGKDPGYAVFEKVVQYILPHYQLFLILIAVIFFLALGNFIYRNTNRLSDAVLAYVLYSCLFFAFFSITGIRQTIATAAALYGYELIKKRKIVPFILLILLASTIHRSVLIFIPFYFIATMKKTKLYYVGALLLFPVLMAYKTTFSRFLKEWSGYEDYGVNESAGTFTFTLMLLFVAAMALWRMKTVIRQNEATRQFYNAFILALLFTPLTWVNPSAMRMVQYYSIFMLVLLPDVVKSFQFESRTFRKTVYMVAIIVLIALFAKSNINNEYKFFWQQMELGENY